MTTALVPVRAHPAPKRRLAHVLDVHERTDLVLGLLDHVVDVLRGCGLEVIVLSPAPVAIDAEVWLDERPGLNGAVSAALDRLDLPVLVVHADLPDLAVSDVETILSTPGDVVIARSLDGGTDGLLLRRPIRPAFGDGSALRHAADARARGLRASVIDVPGMLRDLDDERALSASSWRPRP